MSDACVCLPPSFCDVCLTREFRRVSAFKLGASDGKRYLGHTSQRNEGLGSRAGLLRVVCCSLFHLSDDILEILPTKQHVTRKLTHSHLTVFLSFAELDSPFMVN